MNIKSLLLGSAAAVVAVSGARAADAIVIAEPEPVEYVRVCDVYGAGYFYIPGTETCLRIGGYVRYQVAGGDLWERSTVDHQDGSAGETWDKYARLSLQTWTGTETELGTLRTFTETRFTWGNGSPSYGGGDNGYDGTEGSDVVVITAGRPRSPGMSRDDLVTTNEAIVASVTKEIARRSPRSVIVVVSNPLDAMCHVAHAVSGFPKGRVLGMAGILDTARFSAFIAWETGSSVKDVQAMVLGGHGDQMVPVVSATTVGGVPLEQLAPRGRIAKMVDRTRKGGGELVGLLGTSAWYAPGAAAAQMVDAICLDQKRVLPCTALLEGEYGIDGLYMGVPVRLGAGGVEEIVKLKLGADEKKMLKASATAVREVVGVLTTA